MYRLTEKIFFKSFENYRDFWFFFLIWLRHVEIQNFVISQLISNLKIILRSITSKKSDKCFSLMLKIMILLKNVETYN